MTNRTTQDLLAERRYNVDEARRSQCPDTRAMLKFERDTIDRELERRRPQPLECHRPAGDDHFTVCLGKFRCLCNPTGATQ